MSLLDFGGEDDLDFNRDKSTECNLLVLGMLDVCLAKIKAVTGWPRTESYLQHTLSEVTAKLRKFLRTQALILSRILGTKHENCASIWKIRDYLDELDDWEGMELPSVSGE